MSHEFNSNPLFSVPHNPKVDPSFQRKLTLGERGGFGDLLAVLDQVDMPEADKALVEGRP